MRRSPRRSSRSTFSPTRSPAPGQDGTDLQAQTESEAQTGSAKRDRGAGRPLLGKRLRALPAPAALLAQWAAGYRHQAPRGPAPSRASGVTDPADRDHLKRTRPRIERLLGLIVHRYRGRTSRYRGVRKSTLQAVWTAVLVNLHPIGVAPAGPPGIEAAPHQSQHTTPGDTGRRVRSTRTCSFFSGLVGGATPTGRPPNSSQGSGAGRCTVLLGGSAPIPGVLARLRDERTGAVDAGS
jgi:hypothetical protein